jgi:hypothetical protein
MRKIALFVIAAAVTGLVAGVMIAGCGGGGNDSSSQDVTVPELKPPPGNLSGATGDEGTTGATGTSDSTTTTTTPDSTGGAEATTGAAGAQSGGANAPEDTKQKDTPPPKGSPAERFEQFCNDNPGAC